MKNAQKICVGNPKTMCVRRTVPLEKPFCTDAHRHEWGEIGEALYKNSLKSAQPYLSFLQLFTTSPDNATKPMTFGITMSWLKVSVSSQTRSLERREPRKIKRIAMME